MSVEGFNEIFNTVYIAKKLYDTGRFDLVKTSFFDTLDLDSYYEGMYSLLENLFDYHESNYYEDKNVELHVLSNADIVDFSSIAGEYGRCNGIPDDINPYFRAAKQEISNQLGFSYCLDWALMLHPEPKRPYHSRLGLFISQEDYVEPGVLAYRLIEIQEWFSDKTDELRALPRTGCNSDIANITGKEAIAA